MFVFAWQHILESHCRVCCLDSSPFVPSNYRFRFQISHFTDFTFFPGGVRKPVKKLWRDYCHVFADRPGLLSRSERNSRWFGQLAKYHLSCTPSRQQNGSMSPSKSTFKTLSHFLTLTKFSFELLMTWFKTFTRWVLAKEENCQERLPKISWHFMKSL